MLGHIFEENGDCRAVQVSDLLDLDEHVLVLDTTVLRQVGLFHSDMPLDLVDELVVRSMLPARIDVVVDVRVYFILVVNLLVDY